MTAYRVGTADGTKTLNRRDFLTFLSTNTKPYRVEAIETEAPKPVGTES